MMPFPSPEAGPTKKELLPPESSEKGEASASAGSAGGATSRKRSCDPQQSGGRNRKRKRHSVVFRLDAEYLAQLAPGLRPERKERPARLPVTGKNISSAILENKLLFVGTGSPNASFASSVRCGIARDRESGNTHRCATSVAGSRD
jgi:hypothetical protein